MFSYVTKGLPASVSFEALGAMTGQTVKLKGMLYKIREMSDFAFVILRGPRSLLQCVYAPESASFPLSMLREGMAVAVTGDVVAEPRSKTGFEVRLRETEVLSEPVEETPVVINGKEVSASLETLLDYRPLTLRNEKERAIFKVQEGICAGFRKFFYENGFTEIHSPKIVRSGAEGGANIFTLDYFGAPAYLAQSPQFYKQAMVGVYERVYEIGPVFRAEKHDTSRHINEYTSVDFEMGFLNSFEELMETETAMLSQTLSFLAEHYAPELTLLNAKLPRCESVPRIRFMEAKELLERECGMEIDDYEDFSPEEEKRLCEEVERHTGSEFVFVTHYKSSKRPFYAMDSAEEPELTESFDLLFRGMEITTGGQRIHGYAEQVEKMRARGMEPEHFESYLMAHKYGLPPHGGLGLGLERFTAKLLGFQNVRRATLFPRDINRLEP
ncbi:MAG: aspartate--tRNA(Asn) ligase [Eubacteriales bacterium]|nr:aspartate--tRNA(Asn) ligase [Eubacteriales bacterium]